MSVQPSVPNLKSGICLKKYKIVQGNFVHFFLTQINYTANNNNILKEQNNFLSRTNVNCPLLDKTGTFKYLINLISHLQHTSNHNITLSP